MRFLKHLSRGLCVTGADAASVLSAITVGGGYSCALFSGGTVTTTHCLGNPGINTPSLAYGSQITVGPFRCRSEQAGVTCTVIKSGKGFLINNNGAVPVGP